MTIINSNNHHNDWLGLSRNSCSNKCQKLGLPTIGFAHWVAIPNQNLMLIFKHQRCVAVNAYEFDG